MKGYWNNPAATAEALQDGWLHTGDLGKLDQDGFLSITGRKKELLVLSNGKKVVPSFLEGLLIADSCIDQAVISGEGRNFLTALIVPNWENLRKALPACLDRPPEELARCGEVTAFLQARIDKCLRDVANWEQVKKIAVLAQPLSVASEELTVSLKLRRQFVMAKYGELIERLYR
jgi:long-chain acyl-CoA synthetase